MSDSPEMKVSRALRPIAEALDEIIAEAAGQRMSFSLVVFGSSEGSRGSYISNCDRDDVAAVYKDLLKRWEENMPDVPNHKIN